jgi:hypothetical protein
MRASSPRLGSKVLRMELGVVAFFGDMMWVDVVVESPEVGANVGYLISIPFGSSIQGGTKILRRLSNTKL